MRTFSNAEKGKKQRRCDQKDDWSPSMWAGGGLALFFSFCPFLLLWAYTSISSSPPQSFSEVKVTERLRWSAHWPPDRGAPSTALIWALIELSRWRRSRLQTTTRGNSGARGGWWSRARRQRGWCRFDLSRIWKPVCFVYLLLRQAAVDMCCFVFFFFPPQSTLSSTTPDLQLPLFAVLSLLPCANRGVKVLPQIEVSYSQCLITVGFNPSSYCFSIVYLSMVPFRSLIIANVSDASYWLFVNIYNIKPWNVQMFLHCI